MGPLGLLPGHRVDSYSRALDAGLADKCRLIDPWVYGSPGFDLVDLGAGTAALAAHQARRFPRSRVFAVDFSPAMIAFARRRQGQCGNLHPIQAAATTILTKRATTVVLSSVLHEVYSYSGDSLEAVARTLCVARDQIVADGRIIIRDFLRPADSGRPVRLRHRRDDVVPGHDFMSFVRRSPRPMPLYGFGRDGPWLVYETQLAAAFEFLLRLGHHELWQQELNERYGFWTLAEALELMRGSELEPLYVTPLRNHWWIGPALWRRVQLEDLTNGAPIRLSHPQMLMVMCRRQPATVLRTGPLVGGMGFEGSHSVGPSA